MVGPVGIISGSLWHAFSQIIFIYLFSICFRSVILSRSPFTVPPLPKSVCAYGHWMETTSWSFLVHSHSCPWKDDTNGRSVIYHLPFIIIFLLLLALVKIKLPDFLIWQGFNLYPFNFFLKSDKSPSSNCKNRETWSAGRIPADNQICRISNWSVALITGIYVWGQCTV